MLPGHVYPEQYQQQLADKVAKVTELMGELDTPVFNIIESPKTHYRLRAEFRVWHQGEELDYIMFDPTTREKIFLTEYPIGAKLINELMEDIKQYIKPNEMLRKKLFQVDFLTTLSQQALVSLIYHRPLDEQWQKEAQTLRDHLRKTYQIDLIGRSRKQKILLDKDAVFESLTINNRTLSYHQVENSFTQPNGHINIEMLKWAISAHQNKNADLLELYCGNGNFSLALANNYRRVLATEISRTSVASAKINIQDNKIDNVSIVRGASEEVTAAIKGNPSTKDLKATNFDEYDFNTVLVDPPRAGLDEATLQLVKDFDHIIYVSCNPETLRDNLVALTETHTIEDFTLFDQFPYTHHIESGVFLKKK